MLEENISRLEARLQELEHPDQDFSVKLHDPYSRSEHGMPSSFQQEAFYLPTPSASTPGMSLRHSRNFTPTYVASKGSGHPSPSSDPLSFGAWEDKVDPDGDGLVLFQGVDMSRNETEARLPDVSLLCV
jgi:hypothetical protein